jgi:hypothetical protein
MFNNWTHIPKMAQNWTQLHSNMKNKLHLLIVTLGAGGAESRTGPEINRFEFRVQPVFLPPPDLFK